MVNKIVTFSGDSDYQLEAAVNIVRQAPEGVYVNVQQGIRRISGATSGGRVGTGESTIGDEHHGDSLPGLSYDFTSTDYVTLRTWENFLLNNMFYPPGSTARMTVAFTDDLNPGGLGTANTYPTEFVIPMPSPATVPVLSATSVDAGSDLTITLTPQVASYRHDLYYSFGSQRNQLFAANVATSETWTTPESLLSEIPTSATGVLTITAVTKDSSGVVLGDRSATTILTVPDSAKPTINSYTLSDDSGYADAPASWMQNVSILSVDAISATATYGATITQTRLLLEGASLPIGGKRKLVNSGSIPATVRVWDSRGQYSDQAIGLNVLAYFTPRVQVYNVFRSDASSVAQEDGQYLSAELNIERSVVDSGSGDQNTLSITIQTRERGTTTWTTRNAIFYPTPAVFNDTILVDGGDVYLNTKSYDVRLIVQDMSYATSGVQSIADRVVATGFVSISVNGTNVGIGKSWEQGALDVAGDIYQDGLKVIDESTTSMRRGTAAQRAAATARYWDMWYETDTGFIMVGNSTGGWRRYSGAISDTAKAWTTTSGTSPAVMFAGRSITFTIPTVLESRETLDITMDPAATTTGYNFIGATSLVRNPTNTQVTIRLMQLNSFTTQAVQIAWKVHPF